MKKYLTFLIPIGLIAFVILLAGFDPNNIDTSNGAPPGYTNSPADIYNCTHCMGGSAIPVTGWITSDIPVDGYYPDSVYTITVNATGVGKKGFEVSPQNLTGSLIGTLTAGSGNKLVGVNKYVTHSSAQTGDPTTWNFKWKAPSIGVGDVTFYGSIVVSKLNTKTTTMTVSQNTVGIAEHKKTGFSVYPNPTDQRFSVSFHQNESAIVNLSLLNIKGEVIRNLMQESIPAGEFSKVFSVDQPSGFYLLRINIGGKDQIQRIIIN